MKYSFLLVLSVLLTPLISQSVYAQNIVSEIGEAFNNLTSGLMGENNTNQSSSNNSNNTNTSGQLTNGTSASSANSAASDNQSTSNQSTNEGGIGSIQELQNLTSGNQQLLENSSSISNNVSLLEGMERSQLGNSIGGNQDAKFEGDVLENATGTGG